VADASSACWSGKSSLSELSFMRLQAVKENNKSPDNKIEKPFLIFITLLSL
jgi:hypothetical protein